MTATSSSRARLSTTSTEDRGSGIAPIAPAARRLGAIQLAVLWGDLAVGVLVMAAGGTMVAPTDAGGLGLGFGPALAAILIGSVLGTLFLGLVAAAGHDHAVPTMVLLRPVLGRGGSYTASVVNVVQLVGWTAFEFWAMSLFAAKVSEEVFGFRAYGLWLVIVATASISLAVAGPTRVIREWLSRAGIWIVLATCGYLTVFLAVRTDWHELFATRHGGVGFPVAVDFVLAMPVSWLPLVADYNRFAASKRENLLGTWGFALGNAWIFALGALLVLFGRSVDSSPEGIAAGILGLSSATIVGVMLLVALLAGETDEAFADIYSSAVSIRNVFPTASRRVAVIGVGVLGAVIAGVVSASGYQTFLLLLGSVFVPLFAVLLAAWLIEGLGPVDQAPTWRWGMLVAWLAGVAAYQWAVPTGPPWWLDWVGRFPGAGRHGWLGASLPSFVASFAVASAALALDRGRRRRAAGESVAPDERVRDG
ncbi:MAG: nucleobase:cation symporter, family [Acidimicrobiia bacterium]|jgi:putative hydroxymethylpyrimidine transporter CytX|nr:nucleobase:cation symporter, family [Acidimicrobiia bacterium]